jgi:hypothetical protein
MIYIAGIVERIIVAIVDVNQSRIVERFVIELDLGTSGAASAAAAAAAAAAGGGGGGGGGTSTRTTTVLGSTAVINQATAFSVEVHLRAFLLKLSVASALLRDLNTTNGAFCMHSRK